MTNNTVKKTALILNAAAFVCGTIGIIVRVARNIPDFFLYYTQLSNVAAVIGSALFIAFRSTGNARLRTFVRGARYLSACGLTMTFLVVMCIFIPFGDTPAMISRLLGHVNGFMHHLVCPVISVISYVWFEEGVKTRKAILIPFIATAIYAFTVYALNFLRLAPAPYPFFEVYDHPVPELIAWFFGLMLLVAAIGTVIRLANLKLSKAKGETI